MSRLCGLFVALLVAVAGCSVGGPVPPPLRDGRLLWSADIQNGGLSSFRAGASWDVLDARPPIAVTTPVRDGQYALAFTIPGRATSPDAICCGARTEALPRFRDTKRGDDLWFGLSTYLQPGFPTKSYWQSIVQFKQAAGGAPALGLYVEDGSFRVEGGYGNPTNDPPFNLVVAPAVTGVWYDWVIHVVFSPDPTKGLVEVWHDGAPALQAYAPRSGTIYLAPSGSDASSSFTIGYNRAPTIAVPGTVVFDDMRIGTTMGSVKRLPVDR